MLLQYDASQSDTNKDGENALEWAIHFSKNEIIDFLINNGIDLQESNNQNALLMAIKAKNLKLVTHLVKKGIPVEILTFIC